MNIYKFNLFNWKDQRGITLVETLVSLVVLSLGLIPTLAILTSSIRIASLIENNLIAANLAQEGAEVARSLRDSNWFMNRAFSYTLIGQGRVQWDTNTTTNLPQPIGANPPLKFDSVTGRYNYTTGVDTQFRRSLTGTMSANPCNCELIIISRVDWTQQGRNRTQSVESHLYNWR